jgi:HK97 family phage prohead protease
MMRLWLDCGLQMKAIGEDGRIEGLGAVFGNVDLGFDRIERGAFRESLRKIKEGVPMLWQHFSDQPIGIWDTLKETTRGLAVGGDINLDTQQGREARSLAKQGAVKGLSIGYIPKDFEFEDEVRVLKRVDLVEVSLATFPMNPEARVAGVKHATRRELEQSLKYEYGLSNKCAKHVASIIRKDIDDSECDTRSDAATEIDIGQMSDRLRTLAKELT